MASYVIITPAHNEEAHLERVIRSVLSQTAKPLRWIIVNDNSSDSTPAIAEQYAEQCDFIRVVTVHRKGDHGFNKKAAAFNEGVRYLKDLTYDFIGNLDADVSFGAEYFEALLSAFARDPRLGVTGGAIYTTVGEAFVTEDETVDSVAGAVQIFRRDCFEAIGGGYLPLPFGGIDAAAEILAKQKGWRVAKQPNHRVYEHRRTGTARATPLGACFRLGRRFHSLGYGPLFYVARCAYRLRDRPVVVGSCVALAGYLEACARRRPVLLPEEVVRKLRREHSRKLWNMLRTSSRKAAPESELFER
jgi:poly-beta-1,6-N-acetyl-D-glucosamine synthase